MSDIITLPENPTPEQVKEFEGKLVDKIVGFILKNKDRLGK